MAISIQPLRRRIFKTILWLTGGLFVFVASIAFTAYFGITRSIAAMTAPAPPHVMDSATPLAPPVHDKHKPTVVVLLGNTVSEPTDVLVPYAMFAESGEYNVYTVAESRAVHTLAGGLDLVPHLSFQDLAAHIHGEPDIIVVPQIADIRAPINASVVTWVGQQARKKALLFSWCTGSEVLAESGAMRGKSATAHWGDIDRLQSVYPNIPWKRGVRYVDDETVISTAGLTAGVDATLHLLKRRNGLTVATHVASALHLPPSRFIEDSRCPQFQFAPADSIFLLNAGFFWPKPLKNIWLHDNMQELDLGAVLDVYGFSTTYDIHTVSSTCSVVSRHGIQFLPREQSSTPPPVGTSRSLVGLPSEHQNEFAYAVAVKDLARRQDTWTAAFAAKRLEIRNPLSLEGSDFPFRVALMPHLIGLAALGIVFAFRALVQKRKQTGSKDSAPFIGTQRLGPVTWRTTKRGSSHLEL